jgi:PTH1 family peptidyl-tRNA hydrolase
MKLIAGLGNPGPRYAGSRHNIGFDVVAELLRRTGGTFREKFHGEFVRVNLGNEPVALLLPMTFMNRSGESVRPAMDFFGVAPEDVVVIHDDLDLPLEKLRVKSGGGHGGHNGLRSIAQHIGSDFSRVRCGIGRPEKGDTTAWVLGRFAPDEDPGAGRMVDLAADAVECWVREGSVVTMNRFNGQEG